MKSLRNSILKKVNELTLIIKYFKVPIFILTIFILVRLGSAILDVYGPNYSFKLANPTADTTYQSQMQKISYFVCTSIRGTIVDKNKYTNIGCAVNIKNSSQPIHDTNGKTYVPKRIEVSLIKATKHIISFKISIISLIFGTSMTNFEPGQLNINFNFRKTSHLSPWVDFEYSPYNKIYITKKKPVKGMFNALVLESNILKKVINKDIATTINRYTTTVSTSESNLLFNTINSIQGIPVRPDLFRMLYFSGITMLSIGYGDIVPIVTYSRMIALLQAFFGLILIALFTTTFYESWRQYNKIKNIKSQKE